jgi:hypothetical protein
MKSSKNTISMAEMAKNGYVQCDKCMGYYRNGNLHRCLGFIKPKATTPEPMPADPAPKIRSAVRASNKTEERFRAEVLIWRGFRSIHPQAMVLEFPSGDSYRPDFVAFCDIGRMFVYEVKARGWLRDPRSKAGIQKFRRAKELHPHVCFVLAILEDTGRWTMEGQSNATT